MHSILTILPLAVSLLLSGCNELMTGVLVGELSTGEPVTGQRLNNLANFEYIILFKDQRCTGTKDGLDMTQEVVVKLTCKNGLTGVANVLREKAYSEGRAVFHLSDGTSGHFGFAS